MEETFGERFKRYRERASLSRQQVADGLGISRAAIALVETGDTKSMEPGNLLRAAGLFGIDPYILQFGERAAAKHIYARRGGSEADVREVPIIGFAVASPDEDGYFDDMGYPPGAGMGYISWPTRDPQAYALEIKRDSYSPRVRPGEFVVVEPNSPVEAGDDVLVKTRGGRKMLKQLLHRRGGDVALGSINQAYKTITISVEEIESMHFVGGIAPRGAKREE